MGLFKSLGSISDIEPTPTIGVKFTTIEYTLDSFLNKIEDGTLEDHQIQFKILDSYDTYMNYDNFVSPSTRESMISLWGNLRFLENLLRVLEENTISVDMVNITTVNKIVYDFNCSYPTTSSVVLQKTKTLLFKIANVLNYKLNLQLSTIMPINIASFISIAFYSSFDQKETIERVNDYIAHIDNLSVENIIYIYSKLYQENFGALFLYTMIYAGREKKKAENNISAAILSILNSMSSVEIAKVLKRYGSYIMLNGINEVRFSLQTLPENFKRIKQIATDIETNYGYEIP